MCTRVNAPCHLEPLKENRRCQCEHDHIYCHCHFQVREESLWSTNLVSEVNRKKRALEHIDFGMCLKALCDAHFKILANHLLD